MPKQKLPKIQSVKLAEAALAAKKIATQLVGGEVLALLGPLGAGKTTFVKALGEELKVKTKITSPTFTLMHKHSARLKGKKIYLCHLDLYRIKGLKEFCALGVQEFWSRPDTITAIEWANKIKKHWPKGVFVVKFAH